MLDGRLSETFSVAERATIEPAALEGIPAAIRGLAEDVQLPLLNAFADAMQVAFVALVPVGIAGFLVLAFLREVRIGDGHGDTSPLVANTHEATRAVQDEPNQIGES